MRNLGSELEQAPVERIAYHHVAAIFHPEDRARATIDEQLAKAGWLVQSREQMNLGAGLGVAVREFQTGFRAGRLRAVRRSQAVRRHRGEAGRHDAVGLLRPGRTLHGQRARAPRPRARARSASNMSPPAPRSCFATTPIRRRGRAASSPFTARRRCGAGLAEPMTIAPAAAGDAAAHHRAACAPVRSRR